MKFQTKLAALAMLSGCSQAPSNSAPAVSGQASGPSRFVATGSEPYWSARIRANQVEFSLADPSNARKIPVTRGAEGAGIILRGSVDGLPFRAKIAPGDCYDTTSRKSFSHAIDLQIGEENFAGCAREDSTGKAGA